MSLKEINCINRENTPDRTAFGMWPHRAPKWSKYTMISRSQQKITGNYSLFKMFNIFYFQWYFCFHIRMSGISHTWLIKPQTVQKQTVLHYGSTKFISVLKVIIKETLSFQLPTVSRLPWVENQLIMARRSRLHGAKLAPWSTSKHSKYQPILKSPWQHTIAAI